LEAELFEILISSFALSDLLIKCGWLEKLQ